MQLKQCISITVSRGQSYHPLWFLQLLPSFPFGHVADYSCSPLGSDVSGRVVRAGECVFSMERLMDGAIEVGLTCRNANIINSDQTRLD